LSLSWVNGWSRIRSDGLARHASDDGRVCDRPPLVAAPASQGGKSAARHNL
jgi:hypothetical protein